MKRLAIIPAVVLALGASAAGAAAQDTAQDTPQTVKELYAAAAYEDALAAVKRLQSDRPREVEQYRLFSLFALGRTAEAQKAMEALISADPAYVLDPVETPPRVRQAFRETRQRLLPDVTRAMYLEARGALDRKDRADAIARFERLLALIDSAAAVAPTIAEMRILASGFLDLSRALPEPAPPAPEPAAPTPQPRPAAADASTAPAEVRPVAIRQELPSWVPTDTVSRRTAYSGSVRVLVGTDGRVRTAELVQEIHPSYDAALLEAARNWMYEPARRNGAPVEAEITVEVHLRPPQ